MIRRYKKYKKQKIQEIKNTINQAGVNVTFMQTWAALTFCPWYYKITCISFGFIVQCNEFK